MYFLNYVDRNAIAQARLNNLEEDLNMTGTEFNTTVSAVVVDETCLPNKTTQVSILFVGYVLMQIPSNMMITRIRPGIYMSSWMLIWAVVSGKSQFSVLRVACLTSTRLHCSRPEFWGPRCL